MMLVYFSYPYSDNPRQRTEEIKKIVKEVIRANPDICPIVPHLSFDGLLGYPEGMSEPQILVWEIEAISRCDALAYDPEYVSTGVMWEIAFAKWMGKKILTFRELMGK